MVIIWNKLDEMAWSGDEMSKKSSLSGEELYLDSIEEQDSEILLSWLQNENTLRLLNSVPASPWTVETIGEWIKRVNGSKNDCLFGIRAMPDGEMIGYLEIDGIRWEDHTCGMSYLIGDEGLRGMGLGYQAVKIGLDYAFFELDMYRVQITIFENNPVSIKLAQKLNFVKEGTFREHIARDGRRYDMYLHGLLRKEWKSEK